MATNRELRKALLSKLDISPQALSQQVQKKIKLLPMSAEEAAYVIAHDNDLKIHKYLKPDQVDRVRALQAQLRSASPANVTASRPATRRANAVAGAREIRFPNNFRVKSRVLSAAKLSEAQEMAQIYPILYVLENSMREVVQRVMRKTFGDDWFDAQLVSGKLKTARQTAVDRLKTEHRWHQRRGAHQVDYIDLGNLGDIILGKQDTFFPAVLGPDVEWFKQFMKELEPSRNVLCHMNPLNKLNAHDVAIKLERWEALIASAGAAIPSPH